MKILSKLQLAALLPLVAFAMLGVLAFDFNRTLSQDYAREETAAQLNQSLSALVTLTYECGVAGGERAAIQWQNQHAVMARLLAEGRTLLVAPGAGNLLADLDQGLRDSATHFAELRRFDGEGRRDEMARELRAQMLNQLLANLYGLAPAADQLRSSAHGELLRTIRQGAWMSTLLLALLAIAIPLLMSLLIRGISKPLEQLQRGMEEVAAGKLAQHLVISSADEIGLLTRGFNEMSEKLAVVTVSRDTLRGEIAERQRVEQELRDSQEKYRVVADNTYDWEFWRDPEGRYLYVSPACARITGHQPGEFLADPELLNHLIHPEDLALHHEHRALETRDKTAMELEFRIINAAREEKWILHSCQPVLGADGSYLGIRGSNQDITARKNMEDSLRQGEQRYRKLFEAANDTIFLLQDGVISDCNAATLKLFGRSREEMLGQPPWLFSPPVQPNGEATPSRGARLIAAALAGESRPFSWLHTRPDGSEFTAEISLTRIELSSGAVLQAVARDITERLKAEEKIWQLNAELEQRVAERTVDLKESQLALMNIVDDLGRKSAELTVANAELQGLDRLKSMFVASMSHELRTPLNSIIGFSTVVLEEWLGPLNAEQKAKLAIVLRTGRHLLTLINDVIDVSKIEAGKLECRVEDFELGQVVAEALELVRKEGEEKGLHFRDATTTLTLHSDRRRFFQCLVNLLSNAVKYSLQGEVVVVSELVSGGGGPDCLRISVRDGGIGIPEAELPRLFTAFSRIHSEQTSTIKGTGLGLYLVKKITTEILQGQVGVESTPGQGSIFYLTVPLYLEERNQKYDDLEKSRHPGEGRGPGLR